MLRKIPSRVGSLAIRSGSARPSSVAARRLYSGLSTRNNFAQRRSILCCSGHQLQKQIVIQRYFSDLPDHAEVPMPALSPTMELGSIVSWEKQEGDEIKAGDVMAQVETDKATVAFEAVDDGFMAKILVEAGVPDVPVGTLVCITVEEQEDLAAFANYTVGSTTTPDPTPAAPTPAAPTPAAPTPSAPTPAPLTPPTTFGGRVLASPSARRVAREKGFDVKQISGTGGPVGRVVVADVLAHSPVVAAATTTPAVVAAVAAAPAPAAVVATGDFVDIPHTSIRKVIAGRLTESKATVPHYYLSMECRVDVMGALRNKINADREKANRLSVNDFVIKAAAAALQAVPEVNSSWQDTSIRQYNYVDISVAVSTPTGLITPIVVDADIKGLDGISKTVKELAGKAQEGTLQPDQFIGGTFTISNLGMFGLDSFSAIINPPQAAILAVGTTTSRLVAAPKGSDEPYEAASYMTVQLSCDHRVIDGAVGARWLQAFKSYIEDPVKMLL